MRAAGATPRCLTIATSDSGGGAGIQADIRAFAAAGCHGASVVVGLTAQNTRGIIAVHQVPPAFITQQLDAVFGDIGADAVKTGALLSSRVVDTVAAFLDALQSAGALPPLVVDPVLHASTGTALLPERAIDSLVRRLLPLATVVTPNDDEATVLAGATGSRRELAERIVARGARAVLITGGHGEAGDHLFDGRTHETIAVKRVASRAGHGGGCTHSATLCAELAKGHALAAAARTAAATAAAAIAHGLDDIGSGEGPVDVIGLRSRRH